MCKAECCTVYKVQIAPSYDNWVKRLAKGIPKEADGYMHIGSGIWCHYSLKDIIFTPHPVHRLHCSQCSKSFQSMQPYVIVNYFLVRSEEVMSCASVSLMCPLLRVWLVHAACNHYPVLPGPRSCLISWKLIGQCLLWLSNCGECSHGMCRYIQCTCIHLYLLN